MCLSSSSDVGTFYWSKRKGFQTAYDKRLTIFVIKSESPLTIDCWKQHTKYQTNLKQNFIFSHHSNGTVNNSPVPDCYVSVVIRLGPKARRTRRPKTDKVDRNLYWKRYNSARACRVRLLGKALGSRVFRSIARLSEIALSRASWLARLKAVIWLVKIACP